MTTTQMRKTRQAFLGTSILEAPFWSIYGMLLFILSKELAAPLIQYTILIALKPVVSLFTPYWSALIYKRPDRLKVNIIAADLIGHLPFFFFPFIQNSWWLVAAGALFLMMKRSIIPAWMEILKLNLPRETREKTFSLGTTLSFVSGILLPFLFGRWMDLEPGIWKQLFPIAALISLTGTLLLLRIPIPPLSQENLPTRLPFRQTLITPWKNTWQLLRKRPDFTRFQIGFMLGGGGLMLMQPALPAFFTDTLELSYTQIAIAISTCKGIGFALTSRIWAHWMPKISLFRFSSLVTLLAVLFPIFLLLATFQLSSLYLAFLTYGVMQAGSKLSWSLSGPTFAGDEDSSVYSSVNVVTVGFRGLIAPFIGSLLCMTLSPLAGLLAGGLLCLCASLYLTRAHQTHVLSATN